MKKIKKIYFPIGFFIILMLIPLCYCFSKNLFLNNDLWFLLSHGQYVVSNGFPVIEPFTLHENLSFVMQQWLSAVIFYLCHTAFGKIGLSILTVAMFIIILVFIYKLCLLVSKKNKYLSVIITLIASLLLLPFIVGRPQIFSYLNLILLLCCLESYVQKKDKRYLIALPIISLIQINVHSAMWWLLFCFMVPYIIGGISKLAKKFKNEIYSIKPLIIVMVIMLLVGLINPYGIDMITYIFKSYGYYTINHLVSEMMVPDITTPFGIAIFLSILVFGIIFSRAKKIKIRYILLLLGGLYLAVSSYRNYPLFVIICLLALAGTFKKVFSGESKTNLNAFQKKLCYSILSVIMIAVLFISNPTYNYSKVHPMEGATNYLLKTTDKKAVIYTNYDDGGYLEYHGFKPYIDARAEVFLKANNKQKDIFLEYFKVQRGYSLSSEFVKSYPFTHFVVQKTDIIYHELKQNKNYKQVYKDDYRSIFVTK